MKKKDETQKKGGLKIKLGLGLSNILQPIVNICMNTNFQPGSNGMLGTILT